MHDVLRSKSVSLWTLPYSISDGELNWSILVSFLSRLCMHSAVFKPPHVYLYSWMFDFCVILGFWRANPAVKVSEHTAHCTNAANVSQLSSPGSCRGKLRHISWFIFCFSQARWPKWKERGPITMTWINYVNLTDLNIWMQKQATFIHLFSSHSLDYHI